MATAAQPASGWRGGRKNARIWWYVHQWVGLKLAIFMSFICLTGTLAVLSNEIDWLLQPSLRVSPATVEGETRWDRVVAAATSWPTTKRVATLNAPVGSAFAVTAVIERKDGGRAILHIHPTTGAVQGEGAWVGAQRILRNMHRHLNLPVRIGVPIVTTLAFLLLLSFASSLFVYKRWWRGFLKPIRWRDARTALGDFHRLAGVWSLWFVLLMALTGIWYFAESVGLEAPNMPKAKAAGTFAAGDAPARFADSLTAARRAFPDLRIERILIPGKAGAPFEFQGQYKALLVRERANGVAVDPATSAVLVIRDGRDLNIHQRISEMADPLHFGTFGGYWTKIIWFLFGLFLTSLSVSGIAIYGLRVARTLPGNGALPVVWLGMGRWRWLALGLVAVSLVMLPALFG